MPGAQLDSLGVGVCEEPTTNTTGNNTHEHTAYYTIQYTHYNTILTLGIAQYSNNVCVA